MLNAMFKLISFLIGLLNGAVSFMLVILIEGALASFYPEFLFKNNPYYLLVLFIPALVEEGTKITVAKRMIAVFSPPEIIIGLGLGFGIIEAVIATSQVSLAVFLSPLAWVHLIFLGTGYLIARFNGIKRNSLLPTWITVSVFLHWAYDIMIYIFVNNS